MAKKKSNLEKTIDKQKKAHPAAFLLVVLFLIAGAVAGYFTVKHFTQNDIFEIVGQQTITLSLGETYEDEGAVAISFGRDVSDKIKVENNINSLEAGRYYIKYTIDDIRYSGVVKYRYIIYLDEEENIDTPTDENGESTSLNLVLTGGGIVNG
mgnify:CR=1 FL=1